MSLHQIFIGKIMCTGTLKEIRRRAVSAATDGFSEEISSYYLFIDRLDSFNLSEPTGSFFCKVHTFKISSAWYFSHIVAIYDQHCHVCFPLHASSQLYQSSLAEKKKRWDVEKEEKMGLHFWVGGNQKTPPPPAFPPNFTTKKIFSQRGRSNMPPDWRSRD